MKIEAKLWPVKSLKRENKIFYFHYLHCNQTTHKIIRLLIIVVPTLLFFRLSKDAFDYNVANICTSPHPRQLSILYKPIAGRYRPVSYPIKARYRFIKNAYWALFIACRIIAVAKYSSYNEL